MERTGIYPTPQHAGIWHKVVLLWEPHTGKNPYAGRCQILCSDVISRMGGFKHQAMNLVLQSKVDLGGWPTEAKWIAAIFARWADTKVFYSRGVTQEKVMCWQVQQVLACRYFHNEAPQAPSNEFGPEKQVKTWRTALWGQVNLGHFF